MIKLGVLMKKCSVGGQAVMEGVMMRTPTGGIALAVRRTDGAIETEFTRKATRARKGSVLGWPVLRGIVTFVETLAIGMRITTRSAELIGEETVEEPSRLEKWLAEKTGKSAMDVAMAVAVVLAVALALGLFVFLPSLANQLIPWAEDAPSIWKSLTEGGVRLLIFLIYISAISLVKDIKRVYMYHGAEHKTLACYEHEAPLTPEEAMKYSRLHPRCGTNYLFLVMAIAILFFALIPYQENLLLRVLTRIVGLPVVAGLSYEVLKLAAASDRLWARIVRAPGMFLQYLTTREPEQDMIEVAIAAFNLAINDGASPVAADQPEDGEARAEDAEDEALPADASETGETA
ncbi:MAG: DUF1385 domain-containing protein [Clostridia bacterium]|nr:DUF1385 domain-containing protein [Clostridia bacterium]